MGAAAAGAAATQQTEVTAMHPYAQPLGSKAVQARHGEVLDTIQDFRYQAAYKLAMDEAHERLAADAARSRLLGEVGPTAGWRPILAGLRRRVGGALVGAGARLQGAGGGALADPASAAATAAS